MIRSNLGSLIIIAFVLYTILTAIGTTLHQDEFESQRMKQVAFVLYILTFIAFVIAGVLLMIGISPIPQN